MTAGQDIAIRCGFLLVVLVGAVCALIAAKRDRDETERLRAQYDRDAEARHQAILGCIDKMTARLRETATSVRPR